MGTLETEVKLYILMQYHFYTGWCGKIGKYHFYTGWCGKIVKIRQQRLHSHAWKINDYAQETNEKSNDYRLKIALMKERLNFVK